MEWFDHCWGPYWYLCSGRETLLAIFSGVGWGWGRRNGLTSERNDVKNEAEIPAVVQSGRVWQILRSSAPCASKPLVV